MTIKKRGGWRWGTGQRDTRHVAIRRRQDENLAAGFCRCGGERRAGRVTCQRCGDRQLVAHATRRAQVLAHYGGKCACCGEAEEAFLTIDHPNEDGNRQRAVEHNHKNLYNWLITHAFPAGFQLLCYNCNYGKARRGGICPHQKK